MALLSLANVISTKHVMIYLALTACYGDKVLLFKRSVRRITLSGKKKAMIIMTLCLPTAYRSKNKN